MGKPSSKGLNQQELMEIAQQQQFMNNPNQHNAFGSTETTFDPETGQATIVQTPDPVMLEGIQRQQNFLTQGPATMGQYNNPIGEMFSQQANRYFDRAGMGMGDFNLNNAGFQGGNTPQPTMPQGDIQGPMIDPSVMPKPPGEISGGLGKGNGYDDPKSMAMQTAMMAQNPMAAREVMMGGMPQQSPQTSMLDRLKQGAANGKEHGGYGQIGGALSSALSSLFKG